jgi:hypothetical protein
MDFNDDDIIIFKNNKLPIIEEVDELNEDIPPEYQTKTVSQEVSDFTITEELFFGDNRTKHDENIKEDENIEYMIEIFKNNKDKSCEFIDVKFRANLLPLRLVDLTNLTELTIKKCKLDELNFIPQNLIKFTCNECGLKIVSCSIFSSCLQYLNLSNNYIELITDFDHLKLTYLNLDDNKLTYINDLCESIETISLKNNLLTNIDFLIKNMKEVYLTNNRIENIEYLLDSIEILDVAKNYITHIVLLPLKLKVFIAYNCKIRNIMCPMPLLLEKIDLYNNCLENIPDFNDNLKWADLSSNDLRKLPKNIKNLEYLDITSNDNMIMNPNEQEWKDFMMNMQSGKQFMMNLNDDITISDKELENNSLYMSSSDSDESTSTDEIFKERILKKYEKSPPKYDSIWSEDLTPSISNNKQNDDKMKDEDIKEIKISTNINSDSNNDMQLLEIINGIRNKKEETINIKIKPKRYVVLHKTYSL